MDVLSDKKVTRLVATDGTTRVDEMDDGNWVAAHDGTVSWRNNNPGNLKFGYADSADHTVKTSRTKEAALESAQSSYKGVVDLDQCGRRPPPSVAVRFESGINVTVSRKQRELTLRVPSSVALRCIPVASFRSRFGREAGWGTSVR